MTSEHFFQAMKFDDPTHANAVASAKNPALALLLGRDPTKEMRKDWEKVKSDVMALALLCKFEQNPEARRVLLETGNAQIIEEAPGPWGAGEDGKGENKLGVLLMATRELLRQGNQAIQDRKLELIKAVGCDPRAELRDSRSLRRPR
jgi:ribA/ribD-fused uncharacterized protein